MAGPEELSILAKLLQIISKHAFFVQKIGSPSLKISTSKRKL